MPRNEEVGRILREVTGDQDPEIVAMVLQNNLSARDITRLREGDIPGEMELRVIASGYWRELLARYGDEIRQGGLPPRDWLLAKAGYEVPVPPPDKPSELDPDTMS
jgi:hypothetical protein